MGVNASGSCPGHLTTNRAPGRGCRIRGLSQSRSTSAVSRFQLNRPRVRRVLSLRGFPVVEALPSMGSAGGRAPLLARFVGTMAPSGPFTLFIPGFGFPAGTRHDVAALC